MFQYTLQVGRFRAAELLEIRAAVIEIDPTEPLRLECEHFLTCIASRTAPLTDGVSALSVLRVLEASQRSMDQGGIPISLSEVVGARV